MPTGYTAQIGDGISFEKFVWSCARGFGALILMRDDPSDAPIPERFEPTDYHQQQLVTLKAELARLDGMSREDAEREATEQYNNKMAYRAKRAAELKALRSKYEAMLAQVEAWTPPTPEHQGLKDFMTSQIKESIDWDCRIFPEDAPRQRTGGDWLSEQIIETRRFIAYHEEQNAKEVERTESRNKWIAALRQSLQDTGKQ